MTTATNTDHATARKTADVLTDTPQGKDVLDWTDLGKEMWSYLTGRGAAISYEFVDMNVEVPRHTGPQAARATWRLNGTLRITTSDRASSGRS